MLYNDSPISGLLRPWCVLVRIPSGKLTAKFPLQGQKLVYSLLSITAAGAVFMDLFRVIAPAPFAHDSTESHHSEPHQIACNSPPLIPALLPRLHTHC
jgi:hypothetical protein